MVLSSLPSPPILLFTPSILRMLVAQSVMKGKDKDKDRVAAADGPGAVVADGLAVEEDGREVVVGAAVAAAASVLLMMRRAPTARKSLNESLKKQVAVFLKFLKKNQSARSTPVSRRNCEPNSSWALPPTKKAQAAVIIIFSCR